MLHKINNISTTYQKRRKESVWNAKPAELFGFVRNAHK